ncbi:putative T7SS-secreted protein [Streptomyces sp. I05A-00742]|uniref:putative T7SS-secreted protein n=1 Tax=Streptomyces sp. I05A-00742 TaxID=2732853 RepID=UPI001487D523|nr:DUF6531 domain-containing protein [Streptomyces sp. I05A-00742]
MTQKDATNPGPDRIPSGADPADLVPGDPEKVDDLVSTLRAYAGAFDDGRERLRALDRMEWEGSGAISFRRAAKKLPGDLSAAHRQFLDVADALQAYAHKLRSVHQACVPLIEEAEEARAASRRYRLQVDDYNNALVRQDSVLPERPPGTDPGVTAMSGCVSRLDSLISEMNEVLKATKRKVDKAAAEAPDKPKSWKTNTRDFLQGAYEGADSLAARLKPWLTGDGKAESMQLAGDIDAAAYAKEHPKEFAKALVNWDEWTKHPARAAGELTPGAILAILSGGGGLLSGGKGARDAAAQLADRVRALRRDGSARERAESQPGKHDKCGTEKCTAGEPVDVVTGELVLPAVDVHLPGALPLVLERTFVAGYSSGGWFGPSWASTLDQRLELDDKGIVYTASDGMLLTYPVPSPGEAVMPTSGPRWPLTWYGTADGAMRISVPEAGRTWEFAPLPGCVANGPVTELPLRELSDRNGHRMVLSYDDQGRPVEVTHSGGYHLAVDTDPTAMRVTGFRLLGAGDGERGVGLIRYGYDDAGDLVEVFNSSGLPLRYTYDEAHRVTSWTDRNGTTFGYVYDHRGRVLRTVGPDNMMSGRFHYDEPNRTTWYTDSLGHRTAYTYNARYKVVLETDPLGNTTRTTWDSTHRFPVTITDPLGRTTHYSYDEQGCLRSVIRPDGTTITAAYSELGLATEVADPGGALWRYTYDERGNRTSAIDPVGAETHYTYDELGHLSSIRNALGHTTTVTMNKAGLPLTVTDPLGNTTTVVRGVHGWVNSLTDPQGNTTRHAWTIEGRPAWVERPDGRRETWKWDAEGNLVRHTNAAGQETSFTYTHFDLPATRTDADGARCCFSYDTELRLTSVTNPDGLRWCYEYDPAGRIVSETDYNGRTVDRSYDGAGCLLSHTNGAGQELRFVRDASDRIVEQHDAEGGVTTYRYDPAGYLVESVNSDSRVLFLRDKLGRVLQERLNDFTTSYSYDALGRRISRVTPSGVLSEWVHDPADRPTVLRNPVGTLDFTYDGMGRETARVVSGRAVLSQQWDEMDRLVSQTVAESGHNGRGTVQGRSYSYRDDGCLTEIQDQTSGVRKFDLDRVGRVVATRAYGWDERYRYDRSGNLTEVHAPFHPSPGKRQFDGTLVRRAGRTHYAYDAQGRVVRKLRRLLNGKKLVWTYRWNSQDRLVGATSPNGACWKYSYDPLGRRTAKCRLDAEGSVAEKTEFVWDDTRLAERYCSAGLVTTWDYRPGTHHPLAQTEHRHFNPLLGSSPPPVAGTGVASGSGDFYAVVTDVVGTPTELVTPDGAVPWQYRTTVWGTAFPSLRENDGPDCPLRFPGQYEDLETGLHYNYLRHYDAETGRYTSPDPLGLLAGPNNFWYGPNPHEWIDPHGLALCRANPRMESGNNKEGWQHIDERHIAGNSAGGHGDLMPPSTTRAQVEEASQKVMEKGTRVSDPSRRIQTFEKRLIVNGMRARYRLVVDSEDGNRVITFFPVGRSYTP